jgi:2-oxoacid:acceptor oxidoreductase gamma subunit (pyruvate/2-ketoisovalerate family)
MSAAGRPGGEANAGEQEMYEVRWHGRGGQGAVTSAKILADAGFRSGYAGVTSAPTFGAERRGAPITASTRLSRRPIRVLSQVTTPDLVVVLDESLLGGDDITAGLKPGAVIIVNTAQQASDLPIDRAVLPDGARVVTADVTGAALSLGLIVGGSPMVNTAMLGAIAAATGVIGLDALEQAIGRAFAPGPAKKNFEAAVLAGDCLG